MIDADAKKEASAKQAEARKVLAEAQAKEDATYGLAEAEIMKAKAAAAEQQGTVEAANIEKKARAEAAGIEAKAEARKKEGLAEAEVTKEISLATAIGESSIIEKKSVAEAAGIQAKADAKRKEGLMEAEVAKEKALAEASGIEEKAAAMKKLDGVGREHEEFKLQLQKEKDVELAQIAVQKEIADAQASVLAEALKSADIDIVGGETMFFDNIVKQISNAKGFDRLVNESENISQIKKYFVRQYGISTEDIKNLSIAALIFKMQSQCTSSEDKGILDNLLSLAKSMGISNNKLS